MAHPQYFMQAIYLTEYQGTGFMDLEESFVNPLKIVLCSPGEVDTDRRMCVKSSSIFQSKNEPEIGPGGKGQAAG